ncbi:MAG: hypothetical protein B6D38_11745 [Anaerolineae bacterium UTCFX1]|nr:MAG: hypothetical protein B6D38_11745 [Anaerolineae bacterium UTCFX1]
MTYWLQAIEQNLTTVIIVAVALFIVIWFVAIFLKSIGKIGLIRGTAQADGGAESLVFGELFSGSVPYFWRMFGLNFILSAPALIFVMAVFVILFGGLIASRGNASALIGVIGMMPVLFACLCLLVPVMFVLGTIFRQAENAIVLEEMGVLPAITRGWEVFKANLGPIILMAIILGVIGFVAGIIITIPFFVIVIPVMLAYAVSGGGSNASLILMSVCACIFLPVALAAQGIIIAYVESAWTLTYIRLTKPQENAPVFVKENAS